MKIGTIYITTRIRLEMDIDKEDVEQFVNELDYDFKGGLVEGVNLVADSEIMDYKTAEITP